MKTDAAKEAEMCALRDQGLTFAEIGKRLGTSRQTAQIVVSRARRAQERLENAQQTIQSLPPHTMPLQEFLIANNASSRLTNIMYWNRYETVGDVLEETERGLLQLPNMGKVSAQELIAILKKHGLDVQRGSEAEYHRRARGTLLSALLSVNRVSTQLKYALSQYHTVGDLLKATERDLLWLPGMGKKRLDELRTLLQKYGLQLKP